MTRVQRVYHRNQADMYPDEVCTFISIVSRTSHRFLGLAFKRFPQIKYIFTKEFLDELVQTPFPFSGGSLIKEIVSLSYYTGCLVMFTFRCSSSKYRYTCEKY